MQSTLNATRDSGSLDRGKIRRTRSIAEFRSETEEVDTFRAFIYGKNRQTGPSSGPQTTMCRTIKVDRRNVVVGARWTREVDFTAQHWTNNFPPWWGRTAAIEHARVYNNFPLFQTLLLKRWIHRTISGILILHTGTFHPSIIGGPAVRRTPCLSHARQKTRHSKASSTLRSTL